jgi:Tfp pilus assembly protein PilO
MSRSIRILLVVAVAAAAVGGYWKFALGPQRDEVAQLDQQVAVQEAQLVQTQSLIATYQGAQKEYKTNYATMVRLGKAVPTDDDTRSLMVQLDTSAKRSGITFESINLNSGAGAGATAGATTNAPGAINAGAYSALPFSFSFTGRYSTLGNFLSRLENFVTLDGDKIKVNGRLLRVESLSLTAGADGWPGIQADVGASAYLLPKTADAAATTPATTTSTTTTTSPGATAPTNGVNAG